MATVQDYQQYIQIPLNSSKTASTAALWQHQVAMLNFASAQPYSLLYAGMSTGKTLVALRYLEQYPGLRLVLCPAKPMGVYAEDYEKFYTAEKPFELIILSGTPVEKKRKLKQFVTEKRNAVVVINYETAYRLPLEQIPFSAAVADEVHRLGTFSGVWSRHLAHKCMVIPHKMAMSGTPFHDARERLYGVYRWLDPILPKRGYPQARLFGAYTEFLHEFCVTRPYNGAQIITGYKNTEALLRLIRPTTLQVKTEDVIDLPALVLRYYTVPLAQETRTAYDTLKEDAVLDFETDAILAPHVLTRVIRLQQLIASGELITEAGETRLFDIQARLDRLQMLVEDLGSQPVVIFTRFRRDVEIIQQLLHKLYPKAGISLLTGGVDEHEKWKQGNTQFLIANVASGSEGIRLVRAQHIIVWSLSYSLKEYQQLIARVRRYGQVSDRVWVHILVSENTVDEVILKAIRDKMEQVDELDKGLQG